MYAWMHVLDQGGRAPALHLFPAARKAPHPEPHCVAPRLARFGPHNAPPNARPAASPLDRTRVLPLPRTLPPRTPRLQSVSPHPAPTRIPLQRTHSRARLLLPPPPVPRTATIPRAFACPRSRLARRGRRGRVRRFRTGAAHQYLACARRRREVDRPRSPDARAAAPSARAAHPRRSQAPGESSARTWCCEYDDSTHAPAAMRAPLGKLLPHCPPSKELMERPPAPSAALPLGPEEDGANFIGGKEEDAALRMVTR